MRRWTWLAGGLAGLAVFSTAGWFYLLPGSNRGFNELGSTGSRITPIEHVNARLGLAVERSASPKDDALSVRASSPGNAGLPAQPVAGVEAARSAAESPPRAVGFQLWSARAAPGCIGLFCSEWGIGFLPAFGDGPDGAASEPASRQARRGRILLSWENPALLTGFAAEVSARSVRMSDALVLAATVSAAERMAREEQIRRERRAAAGAPATAPRVLASTPGPAGAAWMGPQDRAFFESISWPLEPKPPVPPVGVAPAVVFEALVAPPPARTPEWIAERHAEELRIEAEKAEETGNSGSIEASVTVTPEPVTLWLLASGLISLSIASMMRRRRF